ncbi:hypothetical protein ACHWQZ_G003739 [Mnemiopsis leidyi]
MIRLIAVAACLAVALSDVAVPTLHDPIPEFEWGPRIFNGSDALEGEFPFMVRVLFSMNGQTSLCGGALISKQVVITAAHCAVLKDTSTPLQPDAFNIIVGDFNNQYNEHEQWLKVGRVIVHPEYNEATFQNDIALLVLADTYDDKGGKIGTINLPSDDKKGVFYAAGASITVIGWGGIDETGQIADNLQKLTYNVASRADCEAFWGSSINLHDGMMCTHIKDQYLTSHTWGGDSGGPLFASFEGTSYLLGLVSFGVAEPNKDALDVSTNVLFYLPWIHNITNEINGNDGDNSQPDNGTEDETTLDGGETDGETPDGGETDGETPDGGETDNETPDGGETDGETPDGGETDGETPDGGETDGETPDGGETDGETPDGGETDGETPDGGETDGETPDGGETDNETPDGGETDGETPDGGETDGETPDGGETDGETPDGGETDGETPDDSDKANFKLYLRGGSGEHEGIVHVHSNDLDASKAHTICNDRFDSNAAMSVCRHLGYRFGKLQSAKQFLNRDLAQNLVFSFENVWCDSADTDFSDCSMEKYMSSNDSVPCFYGEQAAVSCSNEKFEFEVSTFWNKMTYVKKAPAVKISSVCGADFTKFGEPIWIGGQASAYIFKVDMDGQAEVVNEKLKFKRRKGVFVGKSWTKVEYKTMEEARADTCLVCVVFLDDQPDIYASAADEKNCYGLEQATRSKSVKEAIEIWFGNQ